MGYRFCREISLKRSDQSEMFGPSRGNISGYHQSLNVEPTFVDAHVHLCAMNVEIDFPSVFIKRLN